MKFGAFLLGIILVGCAPREQSKAAPENAPLFNQKDGYILNFGDDFKAGMNSVDNFGISVAIVVDVSGSMSDSPNSGGDKKYIQATNALLTVVDYLYGLSKNQKDLKIQVSILKFSDVAKQVTPLMEVNDETIMKLRGVITPTTFKPTGGTAIGSAVEAGAEVLAQSGTILNSLIVITDGENTGGPDPNKVINALYSDRNNISTADFRVRTSTQLLSFIGFDIGSNTFTPYQAMGARVMSANNKDELEKSLKSLLEADITKLEGK